MQPVWLSQSQGCSPTLRKAFQLHWIKRSIPPDAGGNGCTCPAVKNYSKEFLMSPGASGVFVGNERGPKFK